MTKVFPVSMILIMAVFLRTPIVDAQDEANLLLNPGFEGGTTRDNLFWTPEGGPFTYPYPEIESPEGWLTWWYEYFPCMGTPDYVMGRPEAKVIRFSQWFDDPERILEGDAAVLMFTFWRCHKHGLLQQVDVTPGAWYEFSVYAHSWYSRCSDRPHGPPLDTDCETPVDEAYDLMQVGIDPTGGTDPESPSVMWDDVTEVYGVYGNRLSVRARASASTITVFIKSVTTLPLKHNDNYIDRAELVEIEPASLLRNPSFEGGTARDTTYWTPDGGPFSYPFPGVRSPAGWAVWWYEGIPCLGDADYEMGLPTARVIRTSQGFADPERILAGDAAAQVYTMWTCHRHGLLQQADVVPGVWYEFSLYSHSWYTRCSDRPHDSPFETDCGTPIDWASDSLRVGLDPGGGIDPDGPNVVWGAETEIYGVYGSRMSVTARALNNKITVFVASSATHPLEHNDNYFDMAELTRAHAIFSPLVQR